MVPMVCTSPTPFLPLVTPAVPACSPGSLLPRLNLLQQPRLPEWQPATPSLHPCIERGILTFYDHCSQNQPPSSRSQSDLCSCLLREGLQVSRNGIPYSTGEHHHLQHRAQRAAPTRHMSSWASLQLLIKAHHELAVPAKRTPSPLPPPPLCGCLHSLNGRVLPQCCLTPARTGSAFLEHALPGFAREVQQPGHPMLPRGQRTALTQPADRQSSDGNVVPCRGCTQLHVRVMFYCLGHCDVNLSPNLHAKKKLPSTY